MGAKLNRAATNLGQGASRRRAIAAAADVAADIYNDQAAKAGLKIGSDLAGRPWAGYRVHQREDDAAIIKTSGPVHLHNSPTRAHKILPRGARTNLIGAGPVLPGMARPVIAQAGRKRRTAGAQALKYTGRWSADADHPGTRGKRWASRAVAIIERNAPEAYQKSQSTVWQAVFK